MLVALFLFLYTLLFFSAHIYCMHCLICTNFWSYCSYPFLGPTFFLLSRGKLLQTKIQNSKLDFFPICPKKETWEFIFFHFFYIPLFSGFRPKRKLEILYFFIFRFFSAFFRIPAKKETWDFIFFHFPLFFGFRFFTDFDDFLISDFLHFHVFNFF